ncbi:DsbA family protein [Saccharopolyspora rosea]|uniref:DsbA family protein n=1 Tax=Saccharopolyspora rosea TaxID=524884 RepID=A0ABW3FQL6_9PSEU|nr:thioredoxin domain-containing protein [Saccharopolyspora rosea]
MKSGPGRWPSRTTWLVVTLAVVVVAVLAWGAFSGPRPSPEAEQHERGASRQQQIADRLKALQRREPGDPLAMGSPDAPVVLIEYEDFRCPYCSKFATGVEPQLVDEYVRTGVLRIEWRDFPIFGDESVEMAKAGRAAARQGRFWQFHDAAYRMAYSIDHGTRKTAFPDERIQQIARDAGIADLARFNTDRQDPEVVQDIRVDLAEGQELGASSTPSFLINGQAILGAQPLEEFVSVIEQERANS